MSQQKTGRLLTVPQMAERLQLSVASVYSLVSVGRLPAVRVGNGRGSIRFREEDLASYLSQCAVNAKAIPPVRLRKPAELKHLKTKKGGAR